MGDEVVEEARGPRWARAIHHADGVRRQLEATVVGRDGGVVPVGDVAHEDLGDGAARQVEVVDVATGRVLDVVHHGNRAGHVGDVLVAAGHVGRNAERGELGLGTGEVVPGHREAVEPVGRAGGGVVDGQAREGGVGRPLLHGEAHVAGAGAVDRDGRGRPPRGRGRDAGDRRARGRGGRARGHPEGGRTERRSGEAEAKQAAAAPDEAGKFGHVSRTGLLRRRACGGRRGWRRACWCGRARRRSPVRSPRRGRRRSGRTPAGPAACCG